MEIKLGITSEQNLSLSDEILRINEVNMKLKNNSNNENTVNNTNSEHEERIVDHFYENNENQITKLNNQY